MNLIVGKTCVVEDGQIQSGRRGHDFPALEFFQAEQRPRNTEIPESVGGGDCAKSVKHGSKRPGHESPTLAILCKLCNLLAFNISLAACRANILLFVEKFVLSCMPDGPVGNLTISSNFNHNIVSLSMPTSAVSQAPSASPSLQSPAKRSPLFFVARIAIIIVVGVLILWFLYDNSSVAIQQGDTTVFRYHQWVPILFLAAGTLGFSYGIFAVIGKHKSIRYALAGVFPAALLLIVASGLKNDRFTVNAAGFTSRTGPWYGETTRGLYFEDISRINVISKSVNHGRYTSTDQFLTCELKSGGDETFEVNTLMAMGAKDAVLKAAETKGVPVYVSNQD